MGESTIALPIVTERLILRDFVSEDEAAMHDYASDPEVVRYLMWGPNTAEETAAFMRLTLASQRERPRRTWDLAVARRADGRLIGSCGIRLKDAPDAGMGYVYVRDAWGQGYGTEAARSLLDAGFRQLGLHRIWATCDPENSGSARVLEKAGMRREGHLRRHAWVKGRWRDSLLYAVLEDEWPAAAR